VTVWENIPFNRKQYSRYAFETIRRRVLDEADAFLAVTERARDALLLEGANPDRIRIIPMGVDLERFRPAPGSLELRQSLGLPEDDAMVLSVGAMSYAKGLTFLLHAVARARRDAELSTVRFSLVLVGRDVGGARPEIARLGLSSIVKIVPYVPYSKMPDLYNLASVHVLASVPTPTWQEQFGMALIESLASGTPVLTTMSGSIPEVVGEAAVLVPPADHVALYRGLKGLLLDPMRRQRLSQAGRQRAKALFDRHAVAKQIRALYESLG
jgi:starch synthase